jgi:hypothetical protein
MEDMLRVTLLALLLGGCAPMLEDHVSGYVSRTLYCPRDRVSSHVRSDLRASDYAVVLGVSQPQPDPEVLADPARRAVWEAERARHDDHDNALYSVVIVEACSHRYLYVCGSAITRTHDCIWHQELTDGELPDPSQPHG